MPAEEAPRTLTPGLDRLATGQGFGVGLLAGFAVNEHLTLRATPAAERRFGLVGMIYHVSARSRWSSHLVVRLVVHEPTRWWQRVRFHLLAWGDLVMMRKQLMTLRELAESGLCVDRSLAWRVVRPTGIAASPRSGRR